MSDLPVTPSKPTRGRRLIVLVIAAMALAGIGVAIARSGGRTRPEDDLKAAEEALRQNDPSAARGHLDRVLANTPDDPRALFLAAQAARRADACADAERFLTALERTTRPTPASELEWVLLGVQQGDFRGEEERLRTEVERGHPYAPEILEALAKGYDVSYRWPEAGLVLSRILERYPGHVPALVLRGKVLARIRQLDPAYEDLRKAVEQSPGNASAQTAFASLLNRRGETRAAILHYELAQRLRPGDATIQLGLARALADVADLPAAAHAVDELLAIAPDHPDGLVERSRIHLRQRRAAEAEPLLERATRLAPWHRDAHRLYLLALKELGRTQEADKCEARIAELTAEDALAGRLKLRARDNPGDTAVRWELWLWAVRNGEVEEGIAWLTEILRADPDNTAAHLAFGDYFDRAGQPRRAAELRSLAENWK